MDLTSAVATAGRVMEAAGVATMVVGTIIAGAFSLVRARRDGGDAAFQSFRHGLGRAILLGLEFLIAADIIRTVTERPTLDNVIVLAMIVLIRTFLSFTLEVELEGRWPWQAGRASKPSAGPSEHDRPDGDQGAARARA